jgi:methyl acetate hydrolase
VQELLGRIAALDPEASLGIRIIACFDELIVGNVNTRGLLATAAALAGAPAGFRDRGGRAQCLRVGPDGETLDPVADAAGRNVLSEADLEVWLERDGAPFANDAIILERLLLAVGVRRGRERHELEPRRDLGVVLDAAATPDERRDAAVRLGLNPAVGHRVIAAPLFAVWAQHPSGPGDVVSSEHGPPHAVVVCAEAAVPEVNPSGVGVAADLAGLPGSFASAVTALRLCDPPAVTAVHADEYGGLIEVLGQAGSPTTDDARLQAAMAPPWARATLDALLRASTVREAARLVGVHHSTMQARVETLTADLGYDPTQGYGRTRAAVAFLGWRLSSSRVLDLPTPCGAAPNR